MSNTNTTSFKIGTKTYTIEEIVKPFIKELFVSEENDSISDMIDKPKIDHRYRAFDICHSYFYKNCHPKKKILYDKLNFEGCMVLYSFLANWGMIQKVAPLMQTNVRGLRGIIDFIYKDQNQFLWSVDIKDCNSENTINLEYTINLDHYLPEAIKVEEKEEQKKKVKKWETVLGEIAKGETINSKRDSEWEIKINNDIDALVYCFNEMAYILAKESHFVPTSTLITKIMLGVYGNTPAFDRFVRKTLKERKLHSLSDDSYLYDCRSGFEAVQNLFCEVGLDDFANNNKIPVIDFDGKVVNDLKYKNGKWMDMFAFEYGKKIEELEKAKKAKEEAEKKLKQNA